MNVEQVKSQREKRQMKVSMEDFDVMDVMKQVQKMTS